MNEPNVFISYSHDDVEWTHHFAEALREQQVHVWLDAWEIRPGDSIADAIESGLRNSDTIIAILTRSNAGHPNVLWELGFALSAGKRLIPIISPDLEGAEIPFPFRARQYLMKGKPEVVAREVAEALKGLAA